MSVYVLNQTDVLIALQMARRRGARIDGVDVGRLDQDGWAVVLVEMPHADGAEWRYVALFKVIGSMEPRMGRLTLPVKDRVSLYEYVEDEND